MQRREIEFIDSTLERKFNKRCTGEWKIRVASRHHETSCSRNTRYINKWYSRTAGAVPLQSRKDAIRVIQPVPLS